MRRPSLALLVAPALLTWTLACTDDGGAEEGETNASSGSETADTETGGEVGCLDRSSYCFENEFTPLECYSVDGTPCDPLRVNDPSLEPEGQGDEISFENPEAATCIMESLRDVVPGLYIIQIEPGGQYSRSHRLSVFEDATLIQYTQIWDDKCGDQIETWTGLREAAHFEGCLALATAAEQLECLLMAGTEDCVEADSCPG